MKKEFSLYQLVDSAFPTGAFSHSFGLETAYKENKINNPSELYEWTRSYISGNIAPAEGRAIYIIYQAISNENNVFQEMPNETKTLIQRIDQRLTVSKLSSEIRQGTIKIGKRYLKIVETLYPETELKQYINWIDKKLCYGNPSIVHGWVASYLGVPCDSAIFTHLYASVNNLLQSAVRISAIGQTDAQMILKELFSIMESETKMIMKTDPTEKDLFNYAITQEIEAMRHEILYSRLFMS